MVRVVRVRFLFHFARAEDDTANESESKREAWREPAATAETDSPAYVSRDAKAKGEEDTGKVLVSHG